MRSSIRVRCTSIVNSGQKHQSHTRSSSIAHSNGHLTHELHGHLSDTYHISLTHELGALSRQLVRDCSVDSSSTQCARQTTDANCKVTRSSTTRLLRSLEHKHIYAYAYAYIFFVLILCALDGERQFDGALLLMLPRGRFNANASEVHSTTCIR